MVGIGITGNEIGQGVIAVIVVGGYLLQRRKTREIHKIVNSASDRQDAKIDELTIENKRLGELLDRFLKTNGIT